MADNSLTPKEEFLLNPVTEHNITDAAIASFETNLRHPVKVEVPLSPKQDLHGMPNPYPAGASVNLIPDTTDASNGYVAGHYLKDDGSTVSSTSWCISEYFELDPTTTYTWSNRGSASSVASICFYDENKQFISGIGMGDSAHTFNPPEGTVYCRSSQTTYAFQEQNPTGTAFQLEIGSTATPYQRYSNICPIEGWTGTNIKHRGKNYYVYATDTPRKAQNNYAYPYGANHSGRYVYLEPGRYTITFYKKSGSNIAVGLYYSVNGSTASRLGENQTWSSKIIRSFTSAGAWYNFYLYSSNISTSHAYYFQIERGNVSTNYETFKSKTLPITFTNPATGDPITVYGGTVTLNEDGSADVIRKTNRITVPRDLSSYQIKYETGRGVGIRSLIGSGTYIQGTDSTRAMCSFTNDCRPVNKSHMTSQDWTFFKGSWTSVAEFKAVIEAIYANEELPAFVWYYKNPTTYHFPNLEQLKAFLGTNNVWSDAGNVNVKYLTQNTETGMEYRGDRALELRRRAMLADAPTIHTTVGSSDTGGLASFKSYIKAPVKKIEIPFSPKQDLHGMSNPYPAGASVNLIPDTTNTENGYVAGYYLKSDGSTAADANMYISEYIELDSATTYTWSNRINTATIFSICFYDENKDFISGIAINNQYSHTFTPPEGAVYCRSSQTTYAWQEAASTHSAYQLEIGSTATPYQRYSNICPIMGNTYATVVNADQAFEFETSIAFTHIQEGSGTPSKSNLRQILPKISIVRDDGTALDIYRGTIIVNTDGTSVITATHYLKNITSETVIYSTRTNADGAFQVGYSISPAGKDAGVKSNHNIWSNALVANNSIAVWNFQDPSTIALATWANAKRLYVAPPSSVKNLTAYLEWIEEVGTLQALYPLATPLTYNLSVEETIKALACLDINTQILPITFTNPATGDPITVYGGTVTLNEDGSADVIRKTNRITVPRDLSSYQIKYETGRGVGIRSLIGSGTYIQGTDSTRAMCSFTNDCRPVNKSHMTSQDWTFFKGSWTSVAEFKAVIEAIYANEELPAFVWYYKNPTTYHFPNLEQLRVWLGENNFWCDISDDITVKYWNRGFGN